MALMAVMMALVPMTDPTETRYGSLAANMARTGNFLVPMYTHQGRYQSFDGKPPLFFQAGGVACKVFGVNEFAARLPSMLSALAVIGMVWFTLRRLSGARAAANAALMCATGGVFYLFSGLCMTDMVLTFCTTGALCAYMLFAGSEGRAKKISSVAFFAFLGLGMLAKGPVAVVLCGLPVFVYVCAGKRWKELGRHAWLLGPLAFLAIALPWFALMAARDPGFLEYFFINENFLRFLTPNYDDRYGSPHVFFKGMALVWFAVVNVPWLLLSLGCALTGRGTRRLCARGDFSGHPALSLALAGFVCMTGFWCLTSLAQIQYLLPTAPMFAIWLAMRLEAWQLAEKPWMARVVKGLALVTCAVIMIGLGIAIWLGHEVSGKMPKWMYREVARIRDETPEYADAKFFFAKGAPYSAEFYLPAGSWNVATNNVADAPALSADDFLFITKRDLDKLDAPPARKVALKSGKWTVYAPVE